MKTKYFLYIPAELEEPHFGAVTRIMCNRVLSKVSYNSVLHEKVRSRNKTVCLEYTASFSINVAI